MGNHIFGIISEVLVSEVDNCLKHHDKSVIISGAISCVVCCSGFKLLLFLSPHYVSGLFAVVVVFGLFDSSG